MTQPDQGLKARLIADDFGKSPFANKKEIALYDAWQSGQLITLSDHLAAVKAAVDAEREACAKRLDNEVKVARMNGPHHIPIITALAAAIRARANGGE